MRHEVRQSDDSGKRIIKKVKLTTTAHERERKNLNRE